MNDDEVRLVRLEDAVAGQAIFNQYDPGSPLMEAVLSNNLSQCIRLVKAGQNVNVNDNIGEVPLHQAVLKPERLEIFNYLISLPGIRIDAQSHFGLTPLHKAVESGWGLEPIHKLLELGANIDQCDVGDQTPLLLACRRGWAMAIHLLLVNGADATIATNSSVLPVEAAIKLCSSDLIELLFRYSFDVSCTPPVHLRTLIALSACSTLRFFDDLLALAPEVTYDHSDLEDLAKDLFRVMPFSKFCELSTKFTHLTEDLLACPRSALYDIFQNNDGDEYVKFFCQNTDYFAVFDVNEIYFERRLCELEKLIEYSLIAASYGSRLIIDFHYICIHCSYLNITEVLFHLNFTIRSHPYFGRFKAAQVLCNVALYPQNQVNKESCYESHCYFALSGVPSLMEIGRDSTRQYLINKFQIKNHIQFFTVIKSLYLPRALKEILTFRKCIYS